VRPNSPSARPDTGPSSPPKRSREAAILLLPLALHLILRLLALDGWYERVDVEELNFGLLPAHLVQGLAAPLLDYQTMWREGGSLVVAPFSAVFLALLGPSYFALKVAAIAWHGLIVLTWTAIGRLALGRREGLALGLLLACAPPFAARMQLIALVGHPEGNFLSGLALLGLLLVFGETSRRRRQGAAGLLGISVTLGASFTYSAAPAVGLCLLLALRNRDRLVGVGRPLLAGLALGAIPWLCYFVFRVDLEEVWRSSGEGSGLAALLGISPGAEIYSSVPFLDRLSDLLRLHLFWMWGWMADNESFRSPVNYLLGAAIFGTGAVGLLASQAHHFLRRGGLLPRGPAPPLRPILTGFCAIYILSYLGITLVAGLSYGPDTYDGYRYLAPLFPAFLILSVSGLSLALHARLRGVRVTAQLVTLGLCTAFVWGGPSLEGLAGPSPLRALKGYNTHAVTQLYESKMSDTERRALLLAPGLDLADLSFAEGQRQVEQARSIAEGTLCPPAPIWCRIYLEGFAKGWVSSEGTAPDAEEQLQALVSALRALPKEKSASGFRGMGRGVSLNPPGPHWTEQTIPMLEAFLVSDQELNWFHEGIGLHEPLYRDFHYSRLFGGGAVPQHLAYSRGVGMGFARLLIDPSAGPNTFPIPREVLEPIAAPPWGAQGIAAWHEGFESERRRLAGL